MVMRLTEKNGADEEADGDGGECGKTLEKKMKIEEEQMLSIYSLSLLYVDCYANKK